MSVQSNQEYEVSITKQAKRRQWQGTHTLSVILLYICVFY